MARKNETSPWTIIKGDTARRYINRDTGEIISRRQRDKREGGALARGGFTSYEQKAKQSPPELLQSRPARGRTKSTVKDYSRIKPLPGGHNRRVNVGNTIADYDKALRQILRNKNFGEAVHIGPGVQYLSNAGVEKFFWPQKMTLPDNVISGKELFKKFDEYIKQYYDENNTDIISYFFEISTSFEDRRPAPKGSTAAKKNAKRQQRKKRKTKPRRKKK